MEKTRNLQAEEAQQREPYYTRPDEEQSPNIVATGTYPAITCIGDWVILERDQTRTTIATTGNYGELPTGTVVGVPTDSELRFGDRVYFADRIITQKVQHPAYGPDKI